MISTIKFYKMDKLFVIFVYNFPENDAICCVLHDVPFTKNLFNKISKLLISLANRCLA